MRHLEPYASARGGCQAESHLPNLVDQCIAGLARQQPGADLFQRRLRPDRLEQGRNRASYSLAEPLARHAYQQTDPALGESCGAALRDVIGLPLLGPRDRALSQRIHQFPHVRAIVPLLHKPPIVAQPLHQLPERALCVRAAQLYRPAGSTLTRSRFVGSLLHCTASSRIVPLQFRSALPCGGQLRLPTFADGGIIFGAPWRSWRCFAPTVRC